MTTRGGAPGFTPPACPSCATCVALVLHSPHPPAACYPAARSRARVGAGPSCRFSRTLGPRSARCSRRQRLRTLRRPGCCRPRWPPGCLSRGWRTLRERGLTAASTEHATRARWESASTTTRSTRRPRGSKSEQPPAACPTPFPRALAPRVPHARGVCSCPLRHAHPTKLTRIPKFPLARPRFLRPVRAAAPVPAARITERARGGQAADRAAEAAACAAAQRQGPRDPQGLCRRRPQARHRSAGRCGGHPYASSCPLADILADEGARQLTHPITEQDRPKAECWRTVG